MERNKSIVGHNVEEFDFLEYFVLFYLILIKVALW